MEPLEEDMDTTINQNTTGRRAGSIMSSIASIKSDMSSSRRLKNSKWRHALGLSFLMVTVFLWTAGNFLASVRNIYTGQDDS